MEQVIACIASLDKGMSLERRVEIVAPLLANAVEEFEAGTCKDGVEVVGNDMTCDRIEFYCRILAKGFANCGGLRLHANCCHMVVAGVSHDALSLVSGASHDIV